MASKPTVATIRLGPGKLSFPSLIEPSSFNGGDEKYTTTLLLPPSFDIAPVMKALNDLCTEVWGKDQKKWPPNARRPESVVRRAEEKEHLAGYEAGWHFISASSREKPLIVDAMLEPVTDPRAVYAGRWANISVRPFVYDNIGVGVSLGLGNVQLLKHDGAFGRTSARQDFDIVAEEMEDEF